MQPTTLDPDIVNLAKAIRQNESGNNPTLPGKSGEYGAYQYTPDKWAKDSAAAGVNVPLKDATIEQQNEVAYKSIAAMKAQGLNIGEIASVWNSGKKDSYLDSSYKGTNTHGASYDVPAYAKSVADTYHQLKNGTGNQIPGASDNTGDIPPPVAPPGAAQIPEGQSGLIAPPTPPVDIPGGATTVTPEENPWKDADTGQNILNGNSGANIDRSKGALKGVLKVIRDASGVDTNPVIKASLAHAPAFAKDVEAEKGLINPINSSQQMGLQDTQLLADSIPFEKGAEIAGTGAKKVLRPVKAGIQSIEGLIGNNKVKSALAAYVLSNLFKNTKVGGAIEKATGIKGLLDLL